MTEKNEQHPAIEVSELTKHFNGFTAVDHISFEVREGEIFGFLGPNGAGKTTSVRMLTGVLEPSEGTATIQGHDIRTEALLSRAHMGIVPEEANVYLDLSVWRNIMLMAELHGTPKKQRVKDAEILLEALDLADRRKNKAKELSKGLRQRLMLCAALVTRPQILLVDEPTSGLDVKSARMIRDIIRERNRRGLTVLLTTHNMDEAEDMCSRIAIINNGRIVAKDTPDGLRSMLIANQYVEARFGGTQPSQDELTALPSVLRVNKAENEWRIYTDIPGVAATHVVKLAESKGADILHIATCKPSLEDIFLYLTEENAEGAKA